MKGCLNISLVLAFLVAGCFPHTFKGTVSLTFYPTHDKDEGDTLRVQMLTGRDTLTLAYGRVRENNLLYVSRDGDSMRLRVWYPVGVAYDSTRLILLIPSYNTTTLTLFPLALATIRRGYVTAMVVPRGSEDLNMQVPTTYGSTEVEDAKEAVQAYIQHSNLSKFRLSVFGASFGGVVALNLAADDPNIAGVAVEGLLYDLEGSAKRLFSAEDFRHLSEKLQGDRTRFQKMSPPSLLPRLRPLPLYIRWGENDRLITRTERDTLEVLLHARSPSADVGVVPNGAHIMRFGFPLSEEKAIQVTEEIADFLVKTLRP